MPRHFIQGHMAYETVLLILTFFEKRNEEKNLLFCRDIFEAKTSFEVAD